MARGARREREFSRLHRTIHHTGSTPPRLSTSEPRSSRIPSGGACCLRDGPETTCADYGRKDAPSRRIVATISAVELEAKGLIRTASRPVKVLNKGKLTKALTIKAAKFSDSAKAAIEAAGGKAEVIVAKRGKAE